MLPPIVVDLGPHVTRAELSYVLDACNEVVAEGVCLPEGEATLDEPRARAIARRASRTARVVEIEVRLTDSHQPPLVRTLRFTREDPPRERWRSVGLAIATLVGEGQRAEAAQQAALEESTAEPAATEPPATEPPATEPAAAKPVTAKPVTAKPAPRPPPEPEAVDDPSDAVRESDDVAPQNGVFIGIGVFGGPALDDGSGRIGASLRGGWVSRGGVMLLGSASYSVRAVSDDTIDVSWLSLEAGVGHRLWLSGELSLGVSVQAGLQQLRFEGSSRSVVRSTSVLNPVATLGVDGWWLPWPRFGFWLALDAHSIGRRSELFVADTRAARTLPVDGTGLLGLGWRIH